MNPPDRSWAPPAPGSWTVPEPDVGRDRLAAPPVDVPTIDVPTTVRFAAAGPAGAAAQRGDGSPGNGNPGGHGPASLVAREVSCWFGAHKVIERASLEMKAGLVTALIGPSGCGKSTFLRTLNRMHELIPDASSAGQVLLDGVDVYGKDLRVTKVRLQIGMVFQRPNPFLHMTIAQNVLSGVRLAGLRVADKDRLVQACLERAGLWRETRNRLNAPAGSLSGGQQQRLCIARALAVSPKVLLMDEPCSALDPTSTRVIEETMRELCADVTIVIVTHNMQQAQRVADDTALFLIDGEGMPGRIVESGPTADVFGRPRDPRTSDYVNGRFG